MTSRLLQKNLGRTAPDHHLAVGLPFECLDVVAHLLRQIAFRAARLHVIAAQPLDVMLAEHRGHRLDAFQKRPDLLQMIALQHCGGLRRLVHVLVVDIPAGKDDVVQLREREEFLDQRRCVIGALAQPDGAHLRHRSDRLRKSAPYCLHSCNERGRHRAHAHNHHSQFARSGRNRLCSSGGLAAALFTRHLALVLSK